MALSFSVGGARGAFDGSFAEEIAGALDHAFGAEGEWEVGASLRYDDRSSAGWAGLARRATAALGMEPLPNLTAFGNGGPTGVYLPANITATTLPLSAGRSLRCASLPGLRNELFELAHHWRLPLDDLGLGDLLQAAGALEQDNDDGPPGRDDLEDDRSGAPLGAEALATFARLALASNEAMRRDCPLWIIAEEAAETAVVS